jgi:hypothetical protein
VHILADIGRAGAIDADISADSQQSNNPDYGFAVVGWKQDKSLGDRAGR